MNAVRVSAGARRKRTGSRPSSGAASPHEETNPVIIGVPKEIKPGEQRVALTPAGVHALAGHGHRVLIEPGAGAGSGFRDDDYTQLGAVLRSAGEAWGEADLVLKVKEPIASEYPRLRDTQVLFTYLHLAAVPELTRALQKSRTVALAYETVQRADGSLPLLTPMSEVAGRLSVQEGAYYLGKAHGGRGILLAGVPGVPPGNVMIIGAGTVGLNAAKIAVGLGADVSVLDVNVDRLRHVDDLFRGQVVTLVSNAFNVARLAPRVDLLVGAVLVAGARAPVLVPEATVKTMKEGSVIVDVAVDQGGCVETMHPTTLAEPIYRVHGVVHYGVANMPALVPRTSTFALTNATLPYVLELAGKGVIPALRANPALAMGLNVCQGRIVHPGVAESVGEATTPLDACLAG
jgi:alanine dehydrogenase